MNSLFFLSIAVAVIGLILIILTFTRVIGDSNSSIIGGIIGGSGMVVIGIIGAAITVDRNNDYLSV
jgi:hypothetical protein